MVYQMRLEIKIRKVMFLDIFPTPIFSGYKDVCGRMLFCFVFFPLVLQTRQCTIQCVGPNSPPCLEGFIV